jgi:hypothetical protein
MGIPVYCTQGTAQWMWAKQGIIGEVLKYGAKYIIGPYQVLPFWVKHNVAEPCGYLVRHIEMGMLCYLTDSGTLPNGFAGINHWLLEANYSTRVATRMVEEGKLHPAQWGRLRRDHLGIDGAVDILRRSTGLWKTITLCHLSNRTSDAEEFLNLIALVAPGVEANIAVPGLTLNLPNVFT